MNKIRSRILAFFLLLVFSQHLGLRLWMHDWFHEVKESHSSIFPSAQNVHLLCYCLEDAMMPLIGSPIITIDIPLEKCSIAEIIYHPPFSEAEKLFYSLKGPPPQSFSSIS